MGAGITQGFLDAMHWAHPFPHHYEYSLLGHCFPELEPPTQRTLTPISQYNSPYCLQASSVLVLFYCGFSLLLMCHSMFNSNVYIFSLLPYEKCQIPHNIISCFLWSDPCSFSLDHFQNDVRQLSSGLDAPTTLSLHYSSVFLYLCAELWVVC